MNAAASPTISEATAIADLRARLDAVRQRIAAARRLLADGPPREALRGEVETMRGRLAELEREHAAALALLRSGPNPDRLPRTGEVET